MNRYIICALSLSLFALGCKKELEPQESSIPSTTTEAAAPNVEQQVQQLNQPQQMNVQPQTTGQPQGNATASGLNPAHGQPGHRCDIAVGAPLSSAPGKAPAMQSGQATVNSNGQVTASPTSPVQISQTQEAPVKTAPGMNPPHGQPGHRCEIAVGAPLNSAPSGTNQASAKVVPVVQDENGKFHADDQTKVKVTTSQGNAVPQLLQAPKE